MDKPARRHPLQGERIKAKLKRLRRYVLGTGATKLLKIHEKINERWEVVVSISDG
jgi:hypothetical protein